MSAFKYICIASIITITVSTYAYAETKANPWSGAYGQVGLIGYESYIPKGASGTTTTASGITFPNSSTANHANGPAANIGIGYNFDLGSSYLLGIGAALYLGHSRSASSTLVTTTPAGASVKTGTYDASNIFSFSLLPGYMINETHLVYAKVGYAGSTINANSSGNYPQQSNRVNGTVYGIGYKQFISGSIYAFGEGNYAVNRAKAVTVLTDSGATVKSTADATGYDFVFGVGYHF
ncbi:outer membrane beta-barrel protein [Polynucleobacter sp. Ross1-W9]|uniref:outer membrane protein n=1 Tax=Polynucleobacter parvulilacunae TaxID=1855631 RepID=UPI001C0BE443|nr:outer membrane beta-barrel protein [Polynucleobacter parvulilacunae]MBU3557369.1 outer membrane beta-barrel protein [Polynucleobacter parvulilacunae]